MNTFFKFWFSDLVKHSLSRLTIFIRKGLLENLQKLERWRDFFSLSFQNSNPQLTGSKPSTWVEVTVICMDRKCFKSLFWQLCLIKGVFSCSAELLNKKNNIFLKWGKESTAPILWQSNAFMQAVIRWIRAGAHARYEWLTLFCNTNLKHTGAGCSKPG